MKVLIDADGCPVVKIAAEETIKRNIRLTLVFDTSHSFDIEGAESVICSKGADSADFALVNRVNGGDIVITQDYGLAAMALAKNAVCINQNGDIYNSSNIDSLLMRRHIGKKIRRAGGRTHGVKKRTAVDDERFRSVFIKLLDNQSSI